MNGKIIAIGLGFLVAGSFVAAWSLTVTFPPCWGGKYGTWPTISGPSSVTGWFCGGSSGGSVYPKSTEPGLTVGAMIIAASIVAIVIDLLGLVTEKREPLVADRAPQISPEVARYTLLSCEKCGAPVWISRSARAYLRRVPAVCAFCSK